MDSLIRQKVDNFFSPYKSQNYHKREIFINSGEDPDGVYYLKEGIVRMYAVSINGEELVINTFKPISFFPMSWVLNDILPRHYYEAMDLVSVVKAPKTEFLKFLEENPDVLMNLLKRIYFGLEGYFTRMEYLMSGNARTRLITELLIFAKRFGESQGENTVVNLKLTEKDIASQTGIARETVSRELQKLKQKGLVEFENNILKVMNIASLENELLVN